MAERSLVDRVLGMWEEGWSYSALKILAEEAEANQQRLAELEEVVLHGRPITVAVVPSSQGGS